MKVFKKVLAIMVAIVLVLSVSLPVMAATPAEITTYATALNAMGLYAGVSATSFDPALGDKLTREQAFVLYCKIMGKAAKVAAVTAADIKAYLTDVFLDASSFSAWAKSYATVLIMDKDISGRGDFTMGPQNIITGTELAVLMLKALKEPVDYSASVSACSVLWARGILSFSDAVALNDIELTRGNAILIFWRTLCNGKIKGGEYIAKDLVTKGIITLAAATANGLLITYDIGTAEAAVAAVQAAPYVTEANYVAYAALVADANAKILLAPLATRAAFTARVVAKVAIVDAVVAAQVAAATLVVDAYCVITAVTTIEASAAAIVKKNLAIASLLTIVNPAARVALAARIEATRLVLEATILLDITSNVPALLGDGLNQFRLLINLKDAFGAIVTTAPSTDITLTTDKGTLSTATTTLYNGAAEVLLTTKLVAANETATIVATVVGGIYNAKTDTVAVSMTITTPVAYAGAISLLSASATSADRAVLVFDKDIDFTQYRNADTNLTLKNTFALTFTAAAGGTTLIKTDVKTIVAGNTTKEMVVLFNNTVALTKAIVYTVAFTDSVGTAVVSTARTFTLADTQDPYVTAVAIDPTNYRKLIITFSEPVKNVALTTKILLNGTTAPLTATIGDDATNRNVVTATFDALITAGNKNLSLGAGAVNDYALNANNYQDKAFTVLAPTSTITLSLTATLSPRMFAVSTNSVCGLTGALVKIQNIVPPATGWTDYVGSYTTELLSDNKTVLVTTAGVLNVMATQYRIFVAKETLIDAMGVKNPADFTIPLNLPIISALDTTTPSLVSIVPKADSETTVTLTFSEPVDLTAFGTVTFTQVNTDGTAITVTPTPAPLASGAITWDKYRTVATMVAAPLSKDKTYKATITSVKDDTGNTAATITSPAFNTMLSAAATPVTHSLISATAINVGTGVNITLTFGKDLSAAESNLLNALVPGSYRIGATNAYLPTGSVVNFGAGFKTIVITIPSTTIASVAGQTITVSETLLASDGSTFANLAARQKMVIAAINIAAIAGVTAPVNGATPVATATATAQYTATVTWSPVPEGTFAGAAATVYTATITITPLTGYTLTGVAANFFTVAGATATNAINAGVVTALFPATAATIPSGAIAGVTAPVIAVAPDLTVDAGTGYTATVSWAPSGSLFAGSTVYTATITITPAEGYTLTGVPANAFTVAGATATNAPGSGVVTAVFPATAAPVAINIAAIAGVTAPVRGATPDMTVDETAQYTATVTWAPIETPFYWNVIYVATITITPKPGYTLAGVAEDFFTVAGAQQALHAANTGVVTAVFPATAAQSNVLTTCIYTLSTPVIGGTPSSTIDSTANYTATITWSGNPVTFAANTVYTATVTITPKFGYTLAGISADYWHAHTTGASAVSVTNNAGSGIVTIIFASTGAGL